MSNDPGAFLRDMMRGWEKMAGGTQPGGGGLATGMQQMTEQALAAANVATRTDMADLASRVTALEASLARIEATLDTLAAQGGANAAPPAVSTTRPRKPGKAKG